MSVKICGGNENGVKQVVSPVSYSVFTCLKRVNWGRYERNQVDPWIYGWCKTSTMRLCFVCDKCVWFFL